MPYHIYTKENLSWATHIQYLCQKLNEALSLIKYLRDSVIIPVSRNVYFTKFESILKYGIIFWWGVNGSNAVSKYRKKCQTLVKGIIC
jgi:hypothetical protein